MIKPQKISKLIGLSFERKAEKFLHKKGLKTINKNFSCRLGEIDLIMTQNQTLVFVEVRARSKSDYGKAIETVNFSKQQKIIKTAKIFLQQNPKIYFSEIRFDVIGIEEEISWIQNAFIIDE